MGIGLSERERIELLSRYTNDDDAELTPHQFLEMVRDRINDDLADYFLWQESLADGIDAGQDREGYTDDQDRDN